MKDLFTKASARSAKRKRVRPSRSDRTASVIRMSVASIGECKSAKTCGQWDTDLADGYCVRCWDRKND